MGMILNEHDAATLEKLCKTEKDAKKLKRALALWMRDLGQSYSSVALFLSLTARTIINIEARYESEGLERALSDLPRSGRPAEISTDTRAYVVATVCSDPPEGFDRWTLELLKEHVENTCVVESISKESLRIILKEHDLKPWQQASWCIPELDDKYIERMEDILEVYEQPYDPLRPLVCFDEKNLQLLDDVRPPQGIAPGQERRVDYEYKRNGTANVFVAGEPLKGVYLTKVTKHRKREDFAEFMKEVACHYEGADKIVLVMDNLNTHNMKSLIERFGEEEGKRIWERFEVHYTPVHGSWLNQAETIINIYSRQCLGRSRIPTLEDLQERTEHWTTVMNQKAVMINWSFSREKARETFKYSYSCHH